MRNTICCSLGYLAEAIILWQHTSTLFVSKHQARIKLAALCALYLILFFLSLFDLKWLNATMYLFANFVFLITQYNLKCHSAFFNSAILTAVMAMCELTVYSMIEYFAPHFFIDAEYFHNMIIFTVFSKIMLFTILYLFLHFLKGRQKYQQQHDNSVLLLVFIPLTSIFIMLTFINICDAYILSPAIIRMILFSAVFLLIANLLMFGISQYNQKKSIEFTEMQLLLQKEANSAEYYEMLLSQNENQSILIHDIKKHLQSIDMLNDKKEHDKINAYIRQLMLSSDLKETAQLCGHEMLNAILYQYKRQCDNMQIAFHADIRCSTMSFITDSDLTSLFCNLLDNVLEAACDIPEAFIEISTRKREKTPFIVITVIKSCFQSPKRPDHEKIRQTKTWFWYKKYPKNGNQVPRRYSDVF